MLHPSEEGGEGGGAKRTFLVLLVEPEEADGVECVLCGVAWVGTDDVWRNGGCSGMQPLSPGSRVPGLSNGVTGGVMWAERELICADQISENMVFCLWTIGQ